MGNRSETKKAALIGISCFFAYAGCYWERNILSSMLPHLIESGVYSRESLGQIGSAFLVTYGVGQLINGYIGDRISAKYMVSGGLFLAGALCLGFPFLHSVPLSFLLWGLCGFFCSMLWGPISKMISENTTPRLGRLVLTFMTVSSIVGAAMASLMAIISSELHSWRFGFGASGIAMILIAALCFLMNVRMERKGIVRAFSTASVENKGAELKPQLVRNAFVLMCFVTILNGIMRNAVVFWIPTFITERFSLSVTTAVSISSILPFVNLLGTLATVAIVKRMQYNEKRVLVLLFAFSAAMFGCMFLLNGRGMGINIAALFLASAAMTGGCNMIFSYYVLDFTDTGRISTITGFLDFISYLFASFANVAFSSFIQRTGWNNIVLSWAVLCVLGAVLSRMANAKCIANRH